MEKENTIEFSRGNLVIEIFESTKLQELQKKVNNFLKKNDITELNLPTVEIASVGIGTHTSCVSYYPVTVTDKKLKAMNKSPDEERVFKALDIYMQLIDNKELLIKGIIEYMHASDEINLSDEKIRKIASKYLKKRK